MVLAVATLLVCGFMIAIYRILRAEERHLESRQSPPPEPIWPGAKNEVENHAAPGQRRA
jgi:hypothetical protein